MKIAIEIDDNNIIADMLDTMVLSHLQNCRQNIVDWQSTYQDDIKHNKKVLKALNVIIEYYGG